MCAVLNEVSIFFWALVYSQSKEYKTDTVNTWQSVSECCCLFPCLFWLVFISLITEKGKPFDVLQNFDFSEIDVSLQWLKQEMESERFGLFYTLGFLHLLSFFVSLLHLSTQLEMDISSAVV